MDTSAADLTRQSPIAGSPAATDSLIARLGPGLVTGAADDDPSGIATYSQVGAQFGYQLGWALFFSLPLMAAIQAISARIGLVTGRGIAQNLRLHYPRPLLRLVVILLLVANVINLGADLGAMAAAVVLLAGGPPLPYVLGFAAICILLEVWTDYERYAAVLKWSTLSLFAYVAVVFVAHVNWSEALRGTLIPAITFDRAHILALIAILGTTISPYLFFWQAGQEVEEQRRRHVKPLCVTPTSAGAEFARLRTDTLVGMTFSNLVALFIVIATAATLHAHGIDTIGSAADAADALRPIAGDFAFALFAIGIIGTGMLAIPVLAGSAAYAVAEMCDWTEGLDQQFGQARSFYAVIMVATIGGGILTLLPIDPMRALFWAAVLNGLLAAPLMAMIMLMARNPRVMGTFILPTALKIVGWIATALMAIVSVGVFLT